MRKVGFMKRVSEKEMVRLSAIAVALLLCGAASSQAGDWQIQSVDNSGPGRSSSLKIDSLGNAHLAFTVEDGNRNPLKYGIWDRGVKRWFVMPVDEGVSTCSLVLDSKQRPHIAYVDFGTGTGAKLRYAHWDGTTWKKQAIPLNSDVIAYYNSIVLDAEDRPSISFYEYRGPKDTEIRIRLRVVTWTGEYWRVGTVDGQEGSGKFNAMAMDAQGRIHLAYANVSAGTAGMRYAYWNGKSWALEVVEGTAENNGETLGYSVAIAVDSENNPHITYSNASSPMVKYAVRRNGRWQIQPIERLAAVGYPDRNAITLDARGNPFVSYYDAGRGTIKLAYKQGSRWAAEAFDSNGAGFASSIQIHGDTIWIAYGDDGRQGIKIASSDLASRTAPQASELQNSATPPAKIQ
jgi:hypothetical protein